MNSNPPIHTETHTQSGMEGGAVVVGGCGGGISTSHGDWEPGIDGNLDIVVKLPMRLQGDSEGHRAFTLQNQVVPYSRSRLDCHAVWSEVVITSMSTVLKSADLDIWSL